MFGRLSSMASLVTALATVLTLSACTELSRPEAYAPAPDPTVALGEAQSATQEDVGLTPAAESVEDFVPSVEDYTPQILIAAAPAPLWTPGTVATEIPGIVGELSIATMADDLVGGLVVGETSGPVIYLKAQADPETLDDAGAQLLDVGYWGGSPRAFLLVGNNVIEWVQLVSEQETASRPRQPHIRLDDEETVVSFSAWGDMQAVATSDQNCGTLRFFNRNGTDLALGGPEDPECTFPGRPSYGAVALSPDGAAVAYTIVEYRADGTEEATELHVRELLGDVPFLQRRIGEGLDRITSIAFDGQRVVFLKESADGSTVTSIDVSGDETSIQVTADEIRSVSFARNPVTVVE